MNALSDKSLEASAGIQYACGSQKATSIVAQMTGEAKACVSGL